MHRKIAITIMALSLGGCLILTSPPASAQSDQQPQKMAQATSGDDKKAVNPRATRTTVTPRATRTMVNPRATRTTVTPRTTRTTVTPRTTRTTVTPRATRTTVTPRATRTTVTKRATRTTVTKRATRKLTPSATRTTVTPLTTRKVTRPAARTVTLSGATARTVTTGRLRGAGRANIRGHNFSVWRSGHRVRHGNRWRTFIALSALSAILIGSDNYYPYAYISAPQPYCEGLTEDGCQLMWQEVETLEGDVVYQCVAYCPWE